jgi:dTDP-4-dehydrorhamnose reductase
MNVIVLGDGLLGSEIVKQTGWFYISRKKNNIDFIQPDSYTSLLKGYDVVLNCIAYTDTYSEDKQKHWDTNYKGVVDLVDFCKINQKKLIHISTDYIYANSISPTNELDIPVHQQNWYGYTKLLGDAYVQLKLKNYLLIRESHKPYPFPYKQAWSNQHTNGDYVHIIADLIIQLINKNAEGVYNVGTEIKTWFNYTKQEFKTIPSSKPEYIPNDITMDLNKLKDAFKRINK